MLPRRDPFNSIDLRVKGSNAHFNTRAHEEKSSNASTAPPVILHEAVFMERQLPQMDVKSADGWPHLPFIYMDLPFICMDLPFIRIYPRHLRFKLVRLEAGLVGRFLNADRSMHGRAGGPFLRSPRPRDVRMNSQMSQMNADAADFVVSAFHLQSSASIRVHPRHLHFTLGPS